MAFCNSCGASLDAGTKFCNKCGAAQSAATTTPAPAAVAPPSDPLAPPAKKSNTLKIVLIIIAVVVGLGIIGVTAVGYMAYRFAKSSHLEEKNGKVKIQSPFGNMETTTDPDEAAKNIGVDLYPGAQMSRNGSATVTIGGMHTTSAVMETSDEPAKVAEFYREKLPNIKYSTAQGDHYSMASGDRDDMISINIQGQGDGKTMIQISRVTKAASTN
jgi:hypothetical protein